MKNVTSVFALLLGMIVCSFADDPPSSIDVFVVGNDCSATNVYGCNVFNEQTLSGSYDIGLFLKKNATATFVGVKATKEVHLRSGSTLVLDWNLPTDSISMILVTLDEDSRIRVADGKSFYADGIVYSGELSSEQSVALAGKILKPIHGVTFSRDGDNIQASLSENDGALIIPQDIEVLHVSTQRIFVEGVYATVLLPFEIAIGDIDGMTVYEFGDVTKDESGWFIAASEMTPSQTLFANRPYLVKVTKSEVLFNASVTLKKNVGTTNSVSVGANWLFEGTYQRIDWNSEVSGFSRAYGFAANTTLYAKPGEFIKFPVGTFTKPMRGFLLYRPSAMPAPAKSVEIRVLKEGEVMAVAGKLEVAPRMDRIRHWTDVKGCSYGKKPASKGFYLEGKK